VSLAFAHPALARVADPRSDRKAKCTDVGKANVGMVRKMKGRGKWRFCQSDVSYEAVGLMSSPPGVEAPKRDGE